MPFSLLKNSNSSNIQHEANLGYFVLDRFQRCPPATSQSHNSSMRAVAVRLNSTKLNDDTLRSLCDRYSPTETLSKLPPNFVAITPIYTCNSEEEEDQFKERVRSDLVASLAEEGEVAEGGGYGFGVLLALVFINPFETPPHRPQKPSTDLVGLNERWRLCKI